MIKGGISILAFLLAALALSTTSCESRRHAQKMLPPVDPLEPQKSWSSEEGMEHLIGARSFAFGTNIDGMTSDGEYAFRAIFKSPEAPTLFKTAYAQATAEGQLYALCGIRVMDRSSFADYASPLRSETREVTTISGCIATNEPIASVVQRIAGGGYDQYFTNRPAPPAVEHPAAAR
jgi:hypothetical protein